MTALPNILSCSRILLTPVFVYLLWQGDSCFIWAIIIFTIAALTDTCDGYIARRYAAMTALGAFLDPIADKILIISSFISFVVLGVISWWVVLLIILRDILVTFLRSLAIKNSLELKTTRLAQWKTVIQFVAIYTAFLGLASQEKVFTLVSQEKISFFVVVVMYLVALITVYTGLDYVWKFNELKHK